MEMGTRYRGINPFNFTGTGGCYAGLNILIFSLEHHGQLFKLGQGVKVKKKPKVSVRPPELRGLSVIISAVY